MTRKDLIDHMTRLGACWDARGWVDKTPGTTARLWGKCRRGDWMLWLAGRAGVDRKALVLAACDCARLALAHVPPGEDRPRIAIEAAERWARGEGASVEEVRDAYAAAYDAAAYAASAAASAASASASAAAYDAALVNAAASSAAYAAAAADDAAARTRTLSRCAALVRRRIPWSTVERALSGRGETP